MKTIRYAAWLAVVLVVAGMAYMALSGDSGRKLAQMASADIGGPFALVRQDGSPITDRELLGRPHAIFFGFTHCPEVCPTTLFEASGWMEKLGADKDKFAVYFITVDPERDTPEILSQYMSSFDGNILGITGDPEEIRKVMRSYKVFAQKVPLDDGDYTMDHTATVYLMDHDGKFTGTIAWGEDPDTAFGKIRRLVDKG